MTNRIAFIDSALSDFSILAATLSGEADVVSVEAGTSAWKQVCAELAVRPRATAIDIFCHARPGELRFGAGRDVQVITTEVLGAEAATLREIGRSLADGAQICLYGCELAARSSGSRFVDQLSSLTGAAVAASTQIVGSTDAGGTWVLDTRRGTFNASSLQPLGYSGTFAVITGSTSDDVLVGTLGRDTLLGLSGDDTLQGGEGRDTYDGGPGNDSLVGGQGQDTYLFGIGSGEDVVVTGDDLLLGDSVALDVVQLGPGISAANLQLDTSGYDLVLTIAGSKDRLTIEGAFTEDGSNVAKIVFSDGSSWDLLAIKSKLTLQGGFDNSLKVAIYGIGGIGDDTLIGSTYSDELLGGEGADVLKGGVGYDNLAGGVGDDTFDGGLGNDQYWTDAGANVYLFGRGSGHDRIDENIYRPDWSAAEPQKNIIQLGADISPDDVTIRNTGGGYVISIRDTADTLTVNAPWAAATHENFFVQNVRFADGTVWDLAVLREQALKSTDGNDTVHGFDASDVLDGLGGDDSLNGGAGADTLHGGLGNDSAEGGEGADVYLVERGFGQDTIANYDSDHGYDADGNWGWIGNSDSINFAADIQVADVSLSRSGTDLLIRINGTTDQLVVQSFFIGERYEVENLRFADGTVWNADAIKHMFQFPSDLPDTLVGYASAESIAGGAGDDVIDAGRGNDTIDGGLGNDYLMGGHGADTYLFGLGSGQDTIANVDGDVLGVNADTIQLGAGIATSDVTLSRSGTDLLISIAGAPDTLTVEGVLLGDNRLIDNIRFADGTVWGLSTIKAALLAASVSDDTLIGFSGADVINGLAGNDTLEGRDGNDTLDGGAGNDILRGGDGADTYLFGIGSGQDIINEFAVNGSSGDTIQLGAGVLTSNVTLARQGFDLIVSINGTTDKLTVQNHFSPNYYGSGNYYGIESIRFADGTVWNEATILSAVQTGSANTDSLVGGTGDDLLSGLGGDNDTLEGGAGDDTLDGGAGSDYLSGEDGADTYRFGVGSGQDIIDDYDYSLGETDTLQLAAGIAPSEVTLSRSGSNLVLALTGTTDQVTIQSYFYNEAHILENIRFADGTIWTVDDVRSQLTAGTAGADSLLGFYSDDVIHGLAGNDTLDGAAGNDTLDGGAGNDSLRGGDGADTYYLGAGSGQDTIFDNDSSGTEIDTIQVAPGITSSQVTVSRSGSNLLLQVTGTTDSVMVQSFFSGDRYVVEDIHFADGTFWTADDVRTALLTGGAGDDSIQGYAGADVLVGLNGNDTLIGNAGNDTLNGGAGNDSLVGGAGSDTYAFGLGSGADTLSDISSVAGEVDTILLGPGVTPANLTLSQVDSNLVLSINGTTDQLTVQNFFSGEQFFIESIRFFDGTQWGLKEMLAPLLVDNDLSHGFGGFPTDDLLLGNGGNDSLYGGGGADTLDGGTGNDFLNGSVGSDVYRFGVGYGQDIINDADFSFSNTSIDTIAFGAGILPTGVTLSRSFDDLVFSITGTTDQLTVQSFFSGEQWEIERVTFENGTVWSLADLAAPFMTGTTGDDALTGLSIGDVMTGLVGNDTLTGNDGNDTLDGGAGNDSLVGGSGADVYLFGQGSGQDTISDVDTAWEQNDTIQLGAGIAVGDVAFGRTGNDLTLTLTASGEQLTIQSFFLSQTNEIERVRFSNGTVLEVDDIKAASLLGSAGNDSIAGFNDRSNLITGAAGNDTLLGGSGSDTLDGGTGNDRLDGGGGQDVYRFGLGSGVDTIVSGVGLDVIALGAGITPSSLVVSSTGRGLGTGNLVLSVSGTTDQLIVQGFFGAAGSQIGEIRFSDGTSWDQSEIVSRTLISTSGNDSLEGFLFNETISGGAGNDTLLGAEGADSLNGGTGNDSLVGGAGNDSLDGGTGDDTLLGGAGDDVYYRDSLNDVITEYVDGGTDVVVSTVNYTLGANLEDLVLATGATNGGGNELANGIVGNAANNILAGADGNDTLNGAGGNDTMYGGAGDDTYVVDAAGDSVNEDASAGNDIVRSSISYTLGSNVENLVLLGGSALSGTGNGLNNQIIGNAAGNVLNGAAGNDTLLGEQGADSLVGGSGSDILDGGLGDDTTVGGAGDDLHKIDSVLDVVVENAGEGTDLVETAINYRLQANFENIAVAGNLGLIVEGNSYGNTMFGNDAGNQLRGLSGNDLIYGYGGNDTLVGGIGADTMMGGDGNDTYYRDDTTDVITEGISQGTDTVISSLNYTLAANLENLVLANGATNGGGNELDNHITGNAANNLLAGGAGDDFLIGMGGVDTMIGGVGDDYYYSDTAADVITEYAGEGIDTVTVEYNYTLGANLENLYLFGNATNGGGNELNNLLYGNGANNLLFGAAGRDSLFGSDGNDTLNGGTGTDSMYGGTGDDLYIVDESADYITEYTDQGIDTAQSSASYTLQNNVENLTLTGTANLTGKGNTLNNVILGNAGANLLEGGEGDDTINGGAGADTMKGGAGDDVFYRDVTTDLVVESWDSGNDTVISSVNYTLAANVENLQLVGAATNGGGNELNNVLTGNAANNLLAGAVGDDTLLGGAGTDTMYGGLGNDVYEVDSLSDVVSESAGQGIDLIRSTISYSLVDTDGAGASGGNVENLQLLGGANINGTGNGLANVIYANTGTNVIDGGAGSDTVSFEFGVAAGGAGVVLNLSVTNGAGESVASGGSGNDTVVRVEHIIGSDAADTLTGNALANRLEGGMGNDSLDGAAGADTMVGGLGNDTYTRDASTDVIVEAEDAGIDTVRSSVNYTLGSNLENLTLLTGATNGGGNELDNIILGNAANNLLVGAAGDDTLNGGTGADTMYGGVGDDTYVRDSTADLMVENAGEGVDTVISTLNYTLGTNLENLLLAAGATNGGGNELNNVLTGNAANNVIAGAAGHDTLDGGAGADAMYGGVGNDTYVRDNAGDVMTEYAGEGTDTVISSLNYTLGANLENLTLIAGATNGGGNSLNNTLVGNAANNVLAGAAGNDTLAGGAGNDTLYGGSGTNLMFGDEGNDTYYRDSATDVIREFHDEGTDTVVTSVNYTLEVNLENLTLATGATNGGGNSLDNVILGNAVGNVLAGGIGNDTLIGGAGNDTIYGGLGNDVFYRDASGDAVIENANEGIDTVVSSVNYTLGANLENLNLATGATNGGGNALNNVLNGNAANNLLSGGAGDDTLIGGAGADTLYGGTGDDVYDFDTASDSAIELAGEGTDTVRVSFNYTLGSNLENVVLTGAATNAGGNTLDNDMQGNANNNLLSGNAGNDTLHGGLGNDTLYGGAGNDSFVFDTALNASTNVDVLMDFTQGDRIILDNDIFIALTGVGGLSGAEFFRGAGLTGSTDDLQGVGIYYDTTSGGLYYDMDGFGGASAVKFATFAGAPSLSSAAFVIQD